MNTTPRTTIRAAALGCLWSGLLLSGACLGQNSLEMPTWTDLFDANSSLKDAVDAAGASGPNGVYDYAEPPYSGLDAVFVGDWVSDGIATDMSALSDADDLSGVIVWNGTVRTEHDVGNAFVFATTDGAPSPGLVLYGAAERFGTYTGDTYIEFEFNQDQVQAIGRNMPLAGGRSEGDLLVRLNLLMGGLNSADIMTWTADSGYQVIASITAVAGMECSGDGVRYLACDPYLASGQFNSEPQFEPWDDYPRDLYNQPVTVSQPNGLLEFGVNVGALLGTNPDYTSIMVKTPEDIVLASFRNLGLWGSSSAGLSGN